MATTLQRYGSRGLFAAGCLRTGPMLPSIDGIATMEHLTPIGRIKINRLSPPKSDPQNGSTHCLWNRLAGQISVRFSASFSGPLFRCLHAACCRLLSIDGIATMECILRCTLQVGHGRSVTDVVRFSSSTPCTRSHKHWCQMHCTFPRFS